MFVCTFITTAAFFGVINDDDDDDKESRGAVMRSLHGQSPFYRGRVTAADNDTDWSSLTMRSWIYVAQRRSCTSTPLFVLFRRCSTRCLRSLSRTLSTHFPCAVR